MGASLCIIEGFGCCTDVDEGAHHRNTEMPHKCSRGTQFSDQYGLSEEESIKSEEESEIFPNKEGSIHPNSGSNDISEQLAEYTDIACNEQQKKAETVTNNISIKVVSEETNNQIVHKQFVQTDMPMLVVSEATNHSLLDISTNDGTQCQIEHLLKTKLTKNEENILGNMENFKIPKNEKKQFHIERDLRKMKYSLRGLSENESKYAKLCVLKYYDTLSKIYTKYCKIGGDVHWLTYFGFLSLLKDCEIVQNEDSESKYEQMFNSVYHFYASSNCLKTNKHSIQLSGLYGDDSFFSKDPWTGIWRLANDKNESSNEYKLRKAGDLRVIGCVKNLSFAQIEGSLKRSDYKRATLQITFKKRRIKQLNAKRIWECTLVPPECIESDIVMNVKWKEINQNAPNIKRGSLKLIKCDELKDDDADIPRIKYLGLSRSEFFDAMLCVSRCLHESEHLYEAMNHFVTCYLNEYVFVNMVKFEQNNDKILKNKMKTNQTVLMRLFKKYSSMNDGDDNKLSNDEWSAMAVELCKAAKTMNNGIWKKGGKPKMYQIEQCFVLSTSDDNENKINFVQFQMCLIHFASVIFKYCPNAKHEVIGMNEKMDLLMKWCKLLEAQKIKIGKKYTRSDTFKRIKSLKMMQQMTPTNENQQNGKSPMAEWSDLNVTF